MRDGIITNEIRYLTADREDEYIIAQANTPLDSERQDHRGPSGRARYAEGT